MHPLLIFLLAVVYIAFYTVSFPARKTIRITLDNKDPLVIPETCVITGEKATSIQTISTFKPSLGIFGSFGFTKVQLDLPFSVNGWSQYINSFPISLKFYKGGLNIILMIPLLGPFFGFFFWQPVAGFLCGIFAIIDLLSNRRQLIKLRNVRSDYEHLYGIDLSVVSEQFAQEFLQINANIPLSEYQIQYARKMIRRIGIFIVVFLIFVIFIIYVVIKAP